MSNSPQYEYMNEVSIDNELICIICNKPLEDPRCTPCDHIFCKGCVIEWLQRNNISCPTCRQHLQIQQLTQANRIVRNILGKLRVKCVMCGKVDLERSDFERHATTECPSICSAADIMCPWSGPRRQLDNHLANCYYQALRPVLSLLMTEGKQLKERLTQQLMEVEKYKDRIRELKEQMVQQKIHTQNDNLHAKERETQHKTQTDQYIHKVRQLEEQLRRGQNQNNEYHNEIRQLKQQTVQVDGYQKEVRYLKEQLKRQTDRSDANQNQICALEEKIKRQRTTIESYQSDTRRFREKLEQQRRVETDGYETQIRNLREKIKEQEIQHRDEIRQLKDTEMHHKADIAEYRSEIQKLKQQCEHQQLPIDEYQAEYQHQKEEMRSVVLQQNEQATSQRNGQRDLVFSRLSNPGTTISSNRTGHRNDRKRLRNRRFERS